MLITTVLQEYLLNTSPKIPEKLRSAPDSKVMVPSLAREFRTEMLQKIHNARKINCDYQVTSIGEDILERMDGAENPEDILGHMPVAPGEMVWIERSVRLFDDTNVRMPYAVLLEGHKNSVEAMLFHAIPIDKRKVLVPDPTSTLTLGREGSISFNENPHMMPYLQDQSKHLKEDVEEIISNQSAIALTNIMQSFVLLELLRQDPGRVLFSGEDKFVATRAERRNAKKYNINLMTLTAEYISVGTESSLAGHIEALREEVKAGTHGPDPRKASLEYSRSEGFNLLRPNALDAPKSGNKPGAGGFLKRLISSNG